MPIQIVLSNKLVLKDIPLNKASINWDDKTLKIDYRKTKQDLNAMEFDLEKFCTINIEDVFKDRTVIFRKAMEEIQKMARGGLLSYQRLLEVQERGWRC